MLDVGVVATCVRCNVQLLATITTDTPHIRSAAIMCLGRVVFEYSGTDVVTSTLSEVVWLLRRGRPGGLLLLVGMCVCVCFCVRAPVCVRVCDASTPSCG